MQKLWVRFLFILLLSPALSYAYNETWDWAVAYSPLSVDEEAYGLIGSVCMKQESNWQFGADVGFHVTDSEFDYRTNLEYQNGWGWSRYYEYYIRYWILTGGCFVGYHFNKIPISLRLGGGVAGEIKEIESKYYNIRDGNAYKHDNGSETDTKINLYLRPEIRIELENFYVSISYWENTDYIEKSIAIGWIF